jgi:light-regulated signal transduction histidine kinase (bacteriophytochrome)
MTPGNEDVGALVVRHLVEILAGRCSITEEDIRACETTGNRGLAEILTGLSILHEDLLYRDEQRRQADAELRDFANRLAQSNRELEAFSSSVAHDLRAPLRSIDGFSQALLDRHSASLDEEGRGYLRRVCAATRRMGTLIDDLLSLSRLTRSQIVRANVDLSFLAREIAEELRSSAPQRDAEFVIEDGLIADGDAILLRAVLVNLLGNAWKYTSKHPRAKIEFGATRAGEKAYFVRDDGAGFDMRHGQKLFTPFGRLHSVGEFEGSGIGLATVQRIVERHGGRVWAEAEVERGAAFFFTLGENR